MTSVSALRSSVRFLASELIRAGADVRVLDVENSIIDVRVGAHREIFLEVGGAAMSHALANLTSHKHQAKLLLREAGLSVPYGEAFAAGDLDGALAFAASLGFPLVVKPVFGTNGHHVHLGLRDLPAVHEALGELCDDRGELEPVIVEEQFGGDEYRVFVTREGDYAVTRRDPPVLVGDGVRTLAALAAQESTRRTSPRINCLGPIVLDREAERFLAQRGLTLESVPAAGEQVQVRGNSNLCTGASGEDWTSRVHPSLIELAMRALAAFPGLPLAGLDVMCTDPTVPQTAATYRILEINPLPGIGMHMAPSAGRSRAVARAVAELYFPELRQEPRPEGLRAIPERDAPPPEAIEEPPHQPREEETTVSQEQPQQHHPIFETCLGALAESSQGEPFELSAAGQATFEKALRALLPSKELEHAVLTVVQFSSYLKDQARSPKAARALLELTARVATPALLARGGGAAAAVATLRSSAEQLAQLEGREPARYEARSDPKAGQLKADPFARFSLAGKTDDAPKKPKRR